MKTAITLLQNGTTFTSGCVLQNCIAKDLERGAGSIVAMCSLFQVEVPLGHREMSNPCNDQSLPPLEGATRSMLTLFFRTTAVKKARLNACTTHIASKYRAIQRTIAALARPIDYNLILETLNYYWLMPAKHFLRNTCSRSDRLNVAAEKT
uniref:Uncharacterized protein n=1 Tax=Glossina pallidipes TaxID=7398 RepID=A0A1A9ZSA8_GLOPL